MPLVHVRYRLLFLRIAYQTARFAHFPPVCTRALTLAGTIYLPRYFSLDRFIRHIGRSDEDHGVDEEKKDFIKKDIKIIAISYKQLCEYLFMRTIFYNEN